MVCTFFGNRDTPMEIKLTLREIVKQAIEKYDADVFYIGNNGNFDRLVRTVLDELTEEYPYIKYYVVLAYLPTKNNLSDDKHTIYPEGLENAPYRFAIVKRNIWMLDKADIVITYVYHTFGNSAKIQKKAINKGKKVFDVYEIITEEGPISI